MAKLNFNANKFLKQLNQAAAESLVEAVIVPMSEQSIKEAPLDESPLRESYQVEQDGQIIIKGNGNGTIVNSGDVKGKDSNIIASYDTPYALIQHENLDFNHPEPGTKAKYLEDPFNKATANMEKKIHKTLNEKIKRFR